MAKLCNVMWHKQAQIDFLSETYTVKRSSITTRMKWLVSIPEMDPFIPVTLWKPRRAWRNCFIPVQVSGGLNWKLATRLAKSQVSMLKFLVSCVTERPLWERTGPDTVSRSSPNRAVLLLQYSEHLMCFDVSTIHSEHRLLCKDMHHYCQKKKSLVQL